MTNTDIADSEAARRKSSTLLPKPDFNLPNIGSIVPETAFPSPADRRPSDKRPSVPQLFVPGASDITIDGNPIENYLICGKTYNMEKPSNEERIVFSRDTFGGRKLRYDLSVIQGPARARACGAGPRSTADRRPVDPPPVVKLSIFDETHGEDITMNYESSFMLYTSLEVARPIAHGRMHTTTHPPVLSGVAVASAAYLEKPERAGYFIFPDLSVRHEGWYRLRFSLFEAIKQAEDADPDNPFGPDDGGEDLCPHLCLSNRRDVQSKPFQVFSAKKFPGLSSSTDLSKEFADQGCRVRIRRDVRQRKRAPELKSEDCSSQPSPSPSYHEHIRTGSTSSGYYRPDPNRPSPSRNPSITNLVHPSPTIPMGPPPRIETAPPYDPRQTEYRPQLPPLQSNLPAPVPYNPSLINRRYNTADRQPTKRAYSSDTYDNSSALKAGQRPDHPYVPRPFDPNGKIEADDDPEDNNDDPYLSGLLTYPRASGEWHTKRVMGYSGP